MPLMILRKRLGFGVRHAVCAMLFLPAGLVSCSNSPPVPPDAFVNATIAASHPNNTQQNTCLYGSPHVVLGVGTGTGGGLPKTVDDGGNQAGAGVHISCTVSGNHVNVQASMGGMMGGTLTVAGPADGSKTVAGDLVGATDGEFSESDCSISLSFQFNATTQQGFASGGRVWAHVSCPTMVNMTGTVVMLANNMQVMETCDGEFDILFENCGS